MDARDGGLAGITHANGSSGCGSLQGGHRSQIADLAESLGGGLGKEAVSRPLKDADQITHGGGVASLSENPRGSHSGLRFRVPERRAQFF